MNKFYALLFSGVMGIALLSACSFFLLRSSRPGPGEKIRSGEKVRKKITAETVMETLAAQAALLAEKKQFKSAAELYLFYRGPFEEETRERRKTLARGYQISERISLTDPPPENGASADTDSDRSR